MSRRWWVHEKSYKEGIEYAQSKEENLDKQSQIEEIKYEIAENLNYVESKVDSLTDDQKKFFNRSMAQQERRARERAKKKGHSPIAKLQRKFHPFS